MNSEIIRNEIVIDWKAIFFFVMKKWWLILLCLIIGAVGGYGLGVLADVPVYESNAVYILSYSSGSDSVGSMSSEYSFLTRIMYNCTKVVEQNRFLDLVAEDINKGVDEDSEEYIPTEVIAKLITYSYATQGTIITINVATGDPDLTFDIITSVTTHWEQYIKDTYHLAGIHSMVFSPISDIERPTEPTPSNVRIMFTAIGAVAFTFIAIASLALTALLDTRIKKEDDLKNRFNVPVLGTVPNFYDPELDKGAYYHYGTSRKLKNEIG